MSAVLTASILAGHTSGPLALRETTTDRRQRLSMPRAATYDQRNHYHFAGKQKPRQQRRETEPIPVSPARQHVLTTVKVNLHPFQPNQHQPTAGRKSNPSVLSAALALAGPVRIDAAQLPAVKPNGRSPKHGAPPSANSGCPFTPALDSAPCLSPTNTRNSGKRLDPFRTSSSDSETAKQAPHPTLVKGAGPTGRATVPSSKKGGNKNFKAPPTAVSAPPLRVAQSKPVNVTSRKLRRRSYSAIEGRGPLPLDQRSTMGITPSRFAAQEVRYAGPTFHNSPAPSDLPIPAFLLGGGSYKTESITSAVTDTAPPATPATPCAPSSVSTTFHFTAADQLACLSLSFPSSSYFLQRYGNPYHPDRPSALVEDEEIYCRMMFTSASVG